jgi:RNA polymerase sigma-70 factor (ECF subfamily)
VDLSRTRHFIRPALDGDESAAQALLERLRPRLVLWAAGKLSRALRAKVEPEDVAQEVLLAVHQGLPSFEGRGAAGEPGDDRAFFAWVFKVAENRIKDLADYHGALKRQPGLLVSQSQTSPSQAALRNEDVARVARAVEELPDDYREVIRLRRFENLEVAEVAELMQRSPNAVRVLYCRALKALKGCLENGTLGGSAGVAP